MDDHRCPPPQVPGLEPVRLLAVGGHACVWLADAGPGGPGGSGAHQVAIKVAHDGDRAAAATVQAEARSLRRASHPNLVRLLDARRAEHGPPALVLELASGGSLADLLAHRPGLSPGEVVTVAVAVCRALAAMHAVGLVHDDVTAANVLFDGRGRPVLADLGSARVIGAAAEVDDEARACAEDVRALGELIRACLGPAAHRAGGASPPAVTLLDLAGRIVAAPGRLSLPDVEHEVWRTATPQPVRGLPSGVDARRSALARRPEDPRSDGPPTSVLPTPFAATTVLSSAELAAASVAATATRLRAAVPVSRPAPTRRRTPGPSAPPTLQPTSQPTAGRRSRHRRSGSVPWRRRAFVFACVAGAIGTCATLVGSWWSRSGAGAPVAAGSTTSIASMASAAPQQRSARPAGADLLPVVRTLAERRALALRGRPEVLAEVDVAGSPAMTADRQLLDRLRRNGIQLADVRFTVGAIDRVSRSSATNPAVVTVVARVSTSGHRQVATGGRVLASVPADPARTVRLTLHHTGQGWRVYAAEPVT